MRLRFIDRGPIETPPPKGSAPMPKYSIPAPPIKIPAPTFEQMNAYRKINGMSTDTPTTQTPTGGKHSAIPYAMHLIPPETMFAMSRILKQGAEKYETEPKPPNQENWRSISDREHINHALAHLYAYLAGDMQDEHLEHALCRVAFAVAVKESGMR